MASKYDDSPELAEGHDLPEAFVHPPPADTVWSPQPSIAPTYVSQPYGETATYSDVPKSTTPAVGGVVGGDAGNYSTAPESNVAEKKTGPTVAGISLVLILSIIIGILSAAVIGLAAGTGVATKNWNDANNKLAVLSSSLAAAQASIPDATPTPTGGGSPSPTPNFNNLTNGCSNDPGDVTGLTYTSPFFAAANFTMYCNKDTPNGPLYSVFANNFNGCMDACAGWNNYNSTVSGKSKANSKCVAVSFIPAWSNAAVAKKGNAPGDCYLKPGPESEGKLTTPNIGTEVHAALLNTS